MRITVHTSGGDWASLFGFGNGQVPTTGGVQFTWFKPGAFDATNQLIGPDDVVVGVATRRSFWSMYHELDFRLQTGEHLELRAEGGLFTRTYHVTDAKGDWRGSWQRNWNRRSIRVGPYELRVLRAGLFNPWTQVETPGGTVAMRWRERWRFILRDVEVTVFPNELPDLKPDDWLTMTLLALHISKDQFRQRGAQSD